MYKFCSPDNPKNGVYVKTHVEKEGEKVDFIILYDYQPITRKPQIEKITDEKEKAEKNKENQKIKHNHWVRKQLKLKLEEQGIIVKEKYQEIDKIVDPSGKNVKKIFTLHAPDDLMQKKDEESKNLKVSFFIQ